MEIRPRYNQHRIGAMLIVPVEAKTKDMDSFVITTKVGSDSYRTNRIDMDCRVLAGKLLNHPELSELITTSSKEFVLVVELSHPKYKRRLLIGGNGANTQIVYKKGTKFPKDFFKKIEKWLGHLLKDVRPKENLFTYGRNEQYGLLIGASGNLEFAMIPLDEDRQNRRMGPEYSEHSWGSYDD